jgi:hypothetical protein
MTMYGKNEASKPQPNHEAMQQIQLWYLSAVSNAVSAQATIVVEERGTGSDLSSAGICRNQARGAGTEYRVLGCN